MKTGDGQNQNDISRSKLGDTSLPTGPKAFRTFKSAKEVLDFAIAREKQAHDTYVKFSRFVTKPEVCRMLEGFAVEELQHVLRLEAVESGKVALDMEEVGSLFIADAVEKPEIRPGISYTNALIVAMRKEKAAFKLYTKLASVSRDPKVKETFSWLAQEEAKHKLRLEVEYDLTVF